MLIQYKKEEFGDETKALSFAKEVLADNMRILIEKIDEAGEDKE